MSFPHSRSYSSADPSHHWTASGWVRFAISSTQEIRSRLSVGASVVAAVELRKGYLSSSPVPFKRYVPQPGTAGRAAFWRTRRQRCKHVGFPPAARRHPPGGQHALLRVRVPTDSREG